MQRFPAVANVHRISVLRAGGLGDLLFALLAIDALRTTYPDAEVTLFGDRVADQLLTGRVGTVHRVVTLPKIPGVGAPPETEADASKIEAFVHQYRDEHFDIAAQLHGGGAYSNPFLQRFGARLTIGTKAEDAPAPDRWIPYVYYQHEVFRWLEVVGLVGAKPSTLAPQIPLTDEERRGMERLRHRFGETIVIHPGATDPRRRWPVDRFARVARELAREGVSCIIVGDKHERELSEQLYDAITSPLETTVAARVHNLAGELSLTELVSVLAAAHVFVGNDSGPRHLAEAVGTPTVSVYWIGNLLNAGPLWRREHRIHPSWTVTCPVCGADVTQVGWTARRCEHDPSFVDGVSTQPVLEDVRSLLHL